MSATEGFRPGETVVGVDGSGPSRAALRWALRRAGEDGSVGLGCARRATCPVPAIAPAMADEAGTGASGARARQVGV